jgi:hypothetical protein
VTCRGSNGVGGEDGVTEGRGNGKVAGGIGDVKVAGVGVSSGKSGVAVVTEVGVGGRLKLVDGWSQLGVISGSDDVTGGGCLVLDVGLLEDSLRLFDRDWLPALAGQ